MVSARNISNKNIWVAAGDGDLDRVKELVEEGTSPNIPDPNTYTPMHAAASYGHLDILDYLISKGGLVDVTDEDNETPLFVVESVQVARFLVEKGATPNWHNHEEMTPADTLEDDYPEVSVYLRSLQDPSTATHNTQHAPSQPSHYTTERASEQLTSDLIQHVQEIMEAAERDGRDPQSELELVVGQTLVESLRLGQGLGATQSTREPGDDGLKRPRLDES